MAERLNDDSPTDGTKLQYLGEDVVLSKSITECGISSGAVIFAVRSNDLLPEVILTPRTSEVSIRVLESVGSRLYGRRTV